MMGEFLDYRKKIQESNQFLAEMLDAPYDTKEDKTVTDKERDFIKKTHGVDDYREYHINDGKNSRMIAYKRKGSYEIHHKLANGVFGKIVHSGHDVNTGFVSTMFDHAKKLVDAGHSVRIAAPDDVKDAKGKSMFDKYHSISKAIARKHGFSLSKPINYSNTSDSPEAHTHKEFTVSKSPLNESTQEFKFVYLYKTPWNPTTDIENTLLFLGDL